MKKINLSLDNQKFSAKPGPKDAAMISTRIASCNTSILLEELAEAISNGQTYCPAAFKNQIRKAANWLNQQIFVADLDESNLSYDSIVNLCNSFEETYKLAPSIIHESFSSTTDNHKWRIIYVLEQPSEDPRFCLALLSTIQRHFNSDKAVVDLARLLYGTTADKLHYCQYNLMPIEQLSLELILESARSSQNFTIDNFKEKPLPATTKMTKQTQFEIIRMQRSFLHSDKPRYQLVWHATRKLAQSGLFSEKIITQEILRACHMSKKFEDYDKDINLIIENAITWGANHQIS